MALWLHRNLDNDGFKARVINLFEEPCPTVTASGKRGGVGWILVETIENLTYDEARETAAIHQNLRSSDSFAAGDRAETDARTDCRR